jgi:3-dehydroquinate synthase
MGMKSHLSDIDGSLPGAEDLVELMAQDKKVIDGQLRFILARGIGQAFVTSDVARADVVTLLSDYLSDTV